MIRQLTEGDRIKTLAFLSKNPGLNLFQIGDIENFGFDSDIQTVWGSFNENDELNGVLLRYRENFIPYFEDLDFNVEGFKSIIKTNDCAKIISGEKVIADQFPDCFEQAEVREMYFCELIDDSFLEEVLVEIKEASCEDARRILDLLVTIEEFSGTFRSTDEICRKIERNGGFAPYGYKLENGNLVIAEDEVEVIRVIYDRDVYKRQIENSGGK